MDTTLLLDSDIIAYQHAATAQKGIDWDADGDKTLVVDDLEVVLHYVDDTINATMDRLNGDNFIVCLSCNSEDNWRKQVLPSYKENRAGVAKPLHLSAIKEAMRSRYECYERPTLEADDIMGILSTHPRLIKGKKIIVSEDKDMKTIPGWLFNPRKDTKPRMVSEEEADRFHMYQTLIGDTTDGYKGCPGIGPAKAEKILDGNGHPEEQLHRWKYVVAAFTAKGLTEEDALVQARVARICRAEDYDFKNKEVILWTP